MNNPYELDVRSRARILDDVMALARANKLNYSAALSFIPYLKKDNNYVPWYSGTKALSYIGTMLSLTQNYGYYQAFMRNLGRPAYQNLTWNDTAVPPHQILNHKLRELILGGMCSWSMSQCINTAWNIFESNFASTCSKSQHGSSSCNKIPPDLRKVVYCNGVRSGGSSPWQYLWSKYIMEPVGIERQAQLYGLSCTKDPWLVTKLLNAVIYGPVLRSEASAVYRELPVNSQVAKEIMWNYVTQNWDNLAQKFGSNLFALGRLITASTSFMNTQTQYNTVSQFISSHNNLGTAQAAFQRSLSVIHTNIEWMQTYSTEVVYWFKQNTH